MKVPFLDLKSINLQYEEGFKEAFDRVLQNGWFVMGEEYRAFEKEFAAYCGVEHCIGVANGLDAVALFVDIRSSVFLNQVMIFSSPPILTLRACLLSPKRLQPCARRT